MAESICGSGCPTVIVWKKPLYSSVWCDVIHVGAGNCGRAVRRKAHAKAIHSRGVLFFSGFCLLNPLMELLTGAKKVSTFLFPALRLWPIADLCTALYGHHEVIFFSVVGKSGFIAQKIFPTSAFTAIKSVYLLLAKSFDGASDRNEEGISFSVVRKSSFIAQKISQTFVCTLIKSVYLSPTDALHGDIGIVKPKDVVVLFSTSGETEELLRLVPCLKVKGAYVVAVSSLTNSHLKRVGDIIHVGVGNYCKVARRKAHAKAIHSRGASILNIGFGMGIVDTGSCDGYCMQGNCDGSSFPPKCNCNNPWSNILNHSLLNVTAIIHGAIF